MIQPKLPASLLVLGMLLFSSASGVLAASKDPFTSGPQYNDYWEEEKVWQEADVEPPAFPLDANLIEIYVSAVATNRYLIDANSLNVGTDSVVRYTLVVRTAGGAENVSYEGMRCDTRQWKTYATGRATPEGGVWTKARIAQWREVENKPVNRHHAALWKDYFCPNGNAIFTADEGRNALKRGGHPDVPNSTRR